MKIPLVQGDTLPYINIVLTTQPDNAPLDVSDPSVVVRVYFYDAEAGTALSTIVCEKVSPTEGKVRFCFDNGVLDVPEGAYEGEVEIDFDGRTQTIFETLKFIVRSQIS